MLQEEDGGDVRSCQPESAAEYLADSETLDEATAVTSQLVFLFLVTKDLMLYESFH